MGVECLGFVGRFLLVEAALCGPGPVDHIKL